MSIPVEWQPLVPPPRPLAPGEQWNVFLSYRSANRAWVMNLYDVLRGFGHEVFLDQVALVAGDQLITRLEDALAASQAGVLVWSDAARDSDWVRREYQVMENKAARKKGFQFVPVSLDRGELPEFAALRVFLDFKDYPDGPSGGELLKLLHAVVGKPLSEEAARFALAQDEAFQKAATQISAAIRNGRPDRLQELFAARALAWRASAVLGCKAAEGLTKLGANDQAIAMLVEIEQEFSRAVRPKQLRALALSRRARDGGAEADLFAAQDILGELYEGRERDPETLGIYGATWMERYKRSGRAADLRQSRDLYAEAFAGARDDYYTGINAAAKSVMIGGDEDLARAAELAAQVQEIVGSEPRRGDYWLSATVGEVLLIQKKYGDAARAYGAAVDMAPAETGSHKSTWAQACRLMDKLQPSADERAAIRKAFEHLPDCDQL